MPERIARGIFTTGQLVLDSPKEFIVDFLQGATRPFTVAQRVVMTPQTMAEFIDTLGRSVEKYTQAFGPPPAPNIPPQDKRPTLAEIYDNFKLPEEQLSGAYANSVLIGFGPTEFFFDFITTFYPTSAVSSRVFLPSQQVPRFQAMLASAMTNFQQRYKK